MNGVSFGKGFGTQKTVDRWQIFISQRGRYLSFKPKGTACISYKSSTIFRIQFSV